MPERRLVIGVIGPGACDAETAARAEEVGRLIALRGAVLLCGGRGGAMEAAARGARAAGGLTVGVLPGASAEETPPNAYIEVALFTGVGEARNWINVCASDALIAVGGGWGTLSEIALAMKARRPVVALGLPWSFEGVERAATPEAAVDQAFARLPAR